MFSRRIFSRHYQDCFSRRTSGRTIKTVNSYFKNKTNIFEMLSRRVFSTCFQDDASGYVFKTVFQGFISVISYNQNRPDNTKIVTQVSNRVW